MSRKISFARLCTLCLLSFSPLAISHAAPLTTAPSTQPTSEDALALLKKLAQQPLRLSTDRDSAADTFCLRFIMRVTSKDGRDLQLQAFIVRKGDRAAILVMSFDGLPYCYMTKDLVLAVDNDRPGGLVEYDKGCPQFIFDADPTSGQVTSQITHGVKLAAPRVVCDLAHLIDSMMPKLVNVHFDPKTREITARTQGSLTGIELSSPEHPSPIGVDEFDVRTRSGMIGVHIGDYPEPLRDLFAINQHAIDGLNVKIRRLGADEAMPIDLTPDYGKDERIRKAAEALASLFRIRRCFPTRSRLHRRRRIRRSRNRVHEGNDLMPAEDDWEKRLVWLPAGDSANPFPEEVLDCRAVALRFTSMTSDKNVAERFTRLRESEGRECRSRLPEHAITFECDLRFPFNGQHDDGPVFRASAMEENWDFYTYDQRLYIRRSWTGSLQHVGELEYHRDAVLVRRLHCNNETIYGSRGFARAQVHFLIVTHMGQKLIPFPIPPNCARTETRTIALGGFNCYGRRSQFAKYLRTPVA